MTRLHNAVVAIYRLSLAAFATLVVPTLAGIVVGLELGLLGAERWPLLGWAAAAPLIYLAWVITFLIVSALEFQIHRRIHGPKPRRLALDERVITWQSAMLFLTYQRLDQIRSLPWTTSMLQLPVLQKLYLLAYAPRASVGKDVLIYGTVYDPDLTEFGDGVVIGGSSALAAHAFSARENGRVAYISAPIRIGANATIGGEARVSLGTTIGEGAVIEPGAVVEPNTLIPPFEVWGGSPARFKRSLRGDEEATTAAASEPMPALDVAPAPVAAPIAPAPSVAAASAAKVDAARRIVAEALDLRVEDVGPDATADDIEGWDSLGQLVIATLIQERHGVAIDAEEVYRIRSVSDVAAVLEGAWAPAAAPAPMERAAVAPAAFEPVRPPEPAFTSEPEPSLPADPELLPLLDAAAVTRALAEREPADAPTHRLDVVLSATFTAQPLVPSMRLWARAFGIDLDAHVAGFDQVETDLLSPTGALVTAPAEALRLVLVRLEDLGPDMAARGARARSILSAIESFADARGRLVVGSLPPPLEPLGEADRAAFLALRAEWSARLTARRTIDIVDIAGVVERLGVRQAADAGAGTSSRMPWSPAACRDIGIELARVARRRFVPPPKVVAIDCDGTLWRGVVGEDGPTGVGVGPEGHDRAFQLFQRRLLALKERGVLLALVSRNEEADVWQVFDTNPGMVLQRSDIAAWRISWRPKSELLRELAAAMGFSLDAFVFLDDDRAVRLEVEANAPGVTVVPLPDEPADRPAAVASLWRFDGAGATGEDRARTQMVQEEQKREQARTGAVDMEAYLRDLGLVVSIHRATDEELPRLAQLTQRTNQFNVSLKRRSVDEVSALASTTAVLSLAARDRFGDYGLVGMAIVDESAGEPTLDTFLMSCRALGRGVEQALLHAVGTIAAAASEGPEPRIVAPWVDGPRNSPAVEFLRGSGFSELEPGVLAAPVNGGFEVPSHIDLDMDREALAGPLRRAGPAASVSR